MLGLAAIRRDHLLRQPFARDGARTGVGVSRAFAPEREKCANQAPNNELVAGLLAG